MSAPPLLSIETLGVPKRPTGALRVTHQAVSGGRTHACRQHAGPGADICGMGDSDVARLVPSGVTAALVALVLVARLACALLLLLRECECCCCIATLSTALCSPCSICCCPQELQVRFKKAIF